MKKNEFGYASNDFLASIMKEQIEAEKKQRQAQIAAMNDDEACAGNSFYDSQGYGTWNISDRD